MAAEAAPALVGTQPITQDVLDTFNVAQDRKANKEHLDNFGGAAKMFDAWKINPEVGLSQAEVETMRGAYGPNMFPESKMASFLELFIGAMEDITLLILLAAALVSLIIGAVTDPEAGWIEGVAIFIAVFLVATLTAGNNYTKELQFRALEKSAQSDERASVLRAGSIERINPNDIVVGDILVLQAGDSIPADCVVFDNSKCKVNESGLTGEPDDLKKSQETDPFLISSCLITECEETRAVVIGVGLRSQWGKIKANLVTESVNTPLQDKLEIMTEQIGKLGLAAAIGTFVVLFIRVLVAGTGYLSGIINAFILAVTIVVVAIPEGLPLAVTIALAYSTKKMYQDQCFIRVLAACETMGNATNICSDKTGTLTENRMTVVEGWFADTIVDQDTLPKILNTLSEVNRNLIAENSCINRVAYIMDQDKDGKKLERPNIIGNKTEGALMLMARTWDFNEETVRKNLYMDATGDRVFAFNSLKKRSTAVLLSHKASGGVRLYCKGATEWVLGDCTHYMDANGKKQPLTAAKLEEINAHTNKMAGNALRTLCLAHRDFADEAALGQDWAENLPDNAELICDTIVGIIDPLRSDVKDAVAHAQRAGVTVRMVTGDNKATASAIARQCGILHPGGTALEGPDYRKMTPAEADAALKTLQVMARSSPDDKYLLVTRLNGYGIPSNEEEWNVKHATKSGVSWETHRDLLLPGYTEEWEKTRPDGGEVVGVTGDGTNDAPALKAADVGLAMGITGTKVAQAASDIVILDDKFSSIVRAIMWGRCVYDNIRKFLQFQLTVNLVALLLVFIGACVGFPEPLNAVQMLWVNLVMDTMGALALATEPPSMELLNRPPYKRSAALVSNPMKRNILSQSIFQLILLLVLLFKGGEYFGVYTPHGHDVGCADFKVDTASTISWDPSTGEQIVNGAVTCSSFVVDCPSGDRDSMCMEEEFTSAGVVFSYDDLVDFEKDCLSCNRLDYTLNTIIFNTFIYCQVFNEYTSRFLFDDVNPFKDLMNNYVFLGVSIVTVLTQTFLVYVGGEFVGVSPLTLNQYLITVALGFIGVPIGMITRFIPVSEDPADFFTTAKAHEIAGSGVGVEMTSKNAA